MKHKIKIFWIGMPQHKIALTNQLNHMIVLGNGLTQDTFLKSQGKFFLSFPCTLFYIFLVPKNYKSKVFWVGLFTTTKDIIEIII